MMSWMTAVPCGGGSRAGFSRAVPDHALVRLQLAELGVQRRQGGRTAVELDRAGREDRDPGNLLGARGGGHRERGKGRGE